MPTARFGIRLRADCPAINAGFPILDDWLDPLRDAGIGTPDVGAFSVRLQLLKVGVRGRIRITGP